ncbi:uncharacterized protein LOC117543330 isoform X3 [Gymnodraco acuticeps]|uniref:Uncharacterized protein LOC117543330 isoform X3 n=1 Tax=Gymnodraco acuticeps TaxID=8218 RepID=A0A6P8TT60_GYMAC|nr:uncharacterized protein LOC117543330 isoform X3 [Gymnodraco acuticeps]
MYLDECILQTRDLKLEESGHVMGEEESKMETNAHSIIGKSPFTQAFQVRRDQAECDILSDDAVQVKNHYLCPGVIDALFKNYMGIFPLWSGLLLGDLSRHRKGTSKKDGSHKTRDTNCHVELWFGLVKHSILLKKKYLRPAEFVSKMYASIQGRYVEHIEQHNLPMHILDKNFGHPSRPDDDHEEQWNKRESSAGHSKSKSKYFNPPKALPNPKSPPATKVKKRKVDQQEQDAQGNLTWLWKKKDTEVVVAVLPSQMKGRILLIRHCELCSLRPHQWLTGEVIEGVFHVAADKFAVLNKMYLLNHYTASVILFGDRTQLISHSLPKVNFDNYEAVLSFVLVNNNHWKLLYIHANTSTVFLVDPAQSIKELDDSEHAAKRIQEYFRMRRTRHSITDWVDVKWKGGVMGHPLQTDGCSCGVVVVKMAKAVMESFPLIPNVNFECSKKYMKRERRELALEILEASGSV